MVSLQPVSANLCSRAKAWKLSRKGFCRNPRGIFPNKVLGEFCGRFFGGFFRAFFLGRKGGKNPPKNPRQSSNRNLGVPRPKSTLQGSCLEKLQSQNHARKVCHANVQTTHVKKARHRGNFLTKERLHGGMPNVCFLLPRPLPEKLSCWMG